MGGQGSNVRASVNLIARFILVAFSAVGCCTSVSRLGLGESTKRSCSRESTSNVFFLFSFAASCLESTMLWGWGVGGPEETQE